MQNELLLIRVKKGTPSGLDEVARWPDFPLKAVISRTPNGVACRLIVTDLADRSLKPLMITEEDTAGFAEAVGLSYSGVGEKTLDVVSVEFPVVLEAEELIKKARHARDRQLTAEQLDDVYNPDGDGEHPEYSRETWRHEVFESNTVRGYWDWVASELQQDD